MFFAIDNDPRRRDPLNDRSHGYRLPAVAEAAEEFELSPAIHHADVSAVDAPLFCEARERNDRLCHRRVAACGTDVPERILEYTAGRPDIADVTNGDDVVR